MPRGLDGYLVTRYRCIVIGSTICVTRIPSCVWSQHGHYRCDLRLSLGVGASGELSPIQLNYGVLSCLRRFLGRSTV